MATRIKSKPVGTYEQDFYVWTLRQAELLRARRFEDLDLDPLIEEVEALARAELNAVLSDAGVVIEHLLELEHSPATEPRAGWRASVREHRRRLRRELTPRLRQLLARELAGLYREVREDTAALLRDYGESAAADALPEACPYDLERLTGSWLP
jgi:Domain of unknown function DUF29